MDDEPPKDISDLLKVVSAALASVSAAGVMADRLLLCVKFLAACNIALIIIVLMKVL